MKIPRIVIAAAKSGSGKTTIVTGLLAALRARGLSVQSFKIGPDYIDPGYHELASGRPGHNLDSWLLPPDRMKEIFVRSACTAEVAIIEGVMGLYDGGREGISSTAEIAKLLKAPVLLVIDAKSMGASAAAVAMGFRAYDPEVEFAGVLLNRIGSATHEAMISEAMEACGIPVLGALHRNDGMKMPERHLGLLPVTENEEGKVVERIGHAVAAQVELEKILSLAGHAAEMEAPSTEGEAFGPVFSGRKVSIAVARDEAFSFYYPESLRVLRNYGAELVEFSPLKDEALPAADGLILGGGFPEMFAERLQENAAMRRSIRDAAAGGMPVYAECGGYMYLMEGLRDFSGREYAMVGAVPGFAQMKERLQMVGYVTAELQQDTVLGAKGRRMRGHEFHFSSDEGTGRDGDWAFSFTRLRNGAVYPAGFARGNILASYLHLHFAGCPEAAANFVAACRTYHG